MITKEYHVSITIPDEVYTNYGETQEYAFAVSEAIKGFIEAGQDSYSNVIEWATFEDLKHAQMCEIKLNDLINNFQKELLK